jgi:hypothetical protein
MELDDASLAVGRFEQSNRPAAVTSDGGIPPARHDALRGEVTAVIAQLDGLIAAASRG